MVHKDNKRALIFLYFCDFMSIDLAITKYAEGYELFFVGCDKSMGLCHPNPSGNKLYCQMCMRTSEKQLHKYIKNKNIPYSFVRISDLSTPIIDAHAKQMSFDYNSVAELKDLTYKEVEIGYGALSTYVSFTRNITPSFNEALHEYLDTMLRAQVRMVDIIDGYIDTVKPDLVVFHNGRFNNVKPFLGVCQRRGIDFITTETNSERSGVLEENNFHNDVPHSVKAIYNKIESAWENAGDNKEVIGASFFEKRRNGKRAGDVVYTKRQNKNELPDGFDKGKYNIAIFNSSEDEYYSVSKEFDNNVMYQNQYVALKDIFEHFKDRDDIHFYLRIHPNLGSVPFKSHTDLYDLDYKNVTILSPYSPVDSYALMEASNKVVVFSSTMGLESSYWGKAVVALDLCEYSYRNIVYEPKTREEMFSLIEDKNLLPLNSKKECLKVACYYLGYHTLPYNHLRPVPYRWKLLGHEFLGTSIYKLCGSMRLYSFIEKCVFYSFIFSKKGRRFWNISKTTK